MGLEVLKGRMLSYKRRRGEASFVFSDDDRDGLGAIAIAAGLTGQSGQAISIASAAASTEEEADYLEFEINGKPVKGWVWRSPFKEGDEIEVAAEWQNDHYELFAIARPEDRIIALYPHCSRGGSSHWRNAWRLWFFGTSLFIVLGIAFLEVIGLFQSEAHSLEFHLQFLQVMVFGFVGFFYPVFALMTWSLARKWMPFVRLSEKVFCAFGWDRPESVDLVKRSKEYKIDDAPPENGVFYFRY